MRTSRVVLCLLLLSAAAPMLAEQPEPAQAWYEIKNATGPAAQQSCGTASESPADVMHKLAAVDLSYRVEDFPAGTERPDVVVIRFTDPRDGHTVALAFYRTKAACEAVMKRAEEIERKYK